MPNRTSISSTKLKIHQCAYIIIRERLTNTGVTYSDPFKKMTLPLEALMELDCHWRGGGLTYTVGKFMATPWRSLSPLLI